MDIKTTIERLKDYKKDKEVQWKVWMEQNLMSFIKQKQRLNMI